MPVRNTYKSPFRCNDDILSFYPNLVVYPLNLLTEKKSLGWLEVVNGHVFYTIFKCLGIKTTIGTFHLSELAGQFNFFANGMHQFEQQFICHFC